MSTNTITELATNPSVAISAGVGTVALNTFIGALPIIINCGMVIYVVLLVCHKAWQFYQDVKHKRAVYDSSE